MHGVIGWGGVLEVGGPTCLKGADQPADLFFMFDQHVAFGDQNP